MDTTNKRIISDFLNSNFPETFYFKEEDYQYDAICLDDLQGFESTDLQKIIGFANDNNFRFYLDIRMKSDGFPNGWAPYISISFEMKPDTEIAT